MLRAGQPRQQGLGCEDPAARGGQLDRQRQPIQPIADLGDGSGALVGYGEGGLTARARSMNSRTASYWLSRASVGRRVKSGSASGGTAYSCSP